MRLVHVIVGMPCSGKTTTSKLISLDSARTDKPFISIDSSRLIMAAHFGLTVFDKDRHELSNEYTWMLSLQANESVTIQKQAWNLLFYHPKFEGKRILVNSHLISLHVIDGEEHFINGYFDESVNKRINSITWLDIDPNVAQERLLASQQQRVDMTIEQRLKLFRYYEETWNQLRQQYSKKLKRCKIETAMMTDVVQMVLSHIKQVESQNNVEFKPLEVKRRIRAGEVKIK
jgi:adenylate kinase family enzyme